MGHKVGRKNISEEIEHIVLLAVDKFLKRKLKEPYHNKT